MNDYAIIEDNVVTNIVIAEVPLDTNWVLVNHISIHIGDSYIDGIFYRNGEKVLSDQELLGLYVEEIRDMKEALNLLGVNIDG